MKEETKNEFLFSHFPFHPLEMGIAKGGKWNRRRGRKSQTLNTQTVVRLSHIAIMFSPNNMSFFANFSSIFFHFHPPIIFYRLVRPFRSGWSNKPGSFISLQLYEKFERWTTNKYNALMSSNICYCLSLKDKNGNVTLRYDAIRYDTVHNHIF